MRYRRFNIVLSDLLANLEIFAVSKTTTQRAEHIRFRLQTITDLYTKIPFDKIIDHPDFDLLVTIKDAISLLHPAVEKIINGEKNIDEAVKIIAIIHQNGQAYRLRLQTIIDKLQQQPGHENDGLRSVDIINGKVYDPAI